MVRAEEVIRAAADLPGWGMEARGKAADLRIVGREHIREDCHEGDAAKDEHRQQREAVHPDQLEARGQADGF